MDISPLSGCNRFKINLIVVDLPTPFPPMNPVTKPFLTENEISFNENPLKVLRTFFNSITFSITNPPYIKAIIILVNQLSQALFLCCSGLQPAAALQSLSFFVLESFHYSVQTQTTLYLLLKK